MATLTLSSPSAATAVDLSAVSAEAGGDKFKNNGRTLFYAKNTNASSRTITLQTAQSLDSIAIADVTITLAQDEEKLIGFLLPRYFNDSDGFVNVSYSAVTGVTVAAIKTM